MAVTFTLKESSQHQLRYSVTSAGAEGGNLEAATMIADAPVGSPIATILATATSSQATARALAFDNPKLLVEFPSANRDADAAWIIDADNNAGALRLTATAAAADALGSYLVISFRHSIGR